MPFKASRLIEEMIYIKLVQFLVLVIGPDGAAPWPVSLSANIG